MRITGMLLLLSLVCLPTAAADPSSPDWTRTLRKLYLYTATDDVDGFHALLEEAQITLSEDYFHILFPARKAFPGGDILRTVAYFKSTRVANFVVRQLEAQVGYEGMAMYFNALADEDGLTFLDWVTIQADSIMAEKQTPGDRLMVYVATAQNFRKMGAKFGCELDQAIVCPQTPEAWFEEARAYFK